MRKISVFCLMAGILFSWNVGAVNEKSSKCEECHGKISPAQVTDFNRGKMAETLDCTACHRTLHQSEKNGDKAKKIINGLSPSFTCQEDTDNGDFDLHLKRISSLMQ